jgi:uncharacterized protein YjbI with pentapeptide repeats
MDKILFEDRIFNKNDVPDTGPAAGEYEKCTFAHCEFSNVDLSGITFVDCAFMGCNLSMARMIGTVLRDAEFKECKLQGVHFENCNQILLSLHFENCILNFSSFHKTKLKKTTFANCILQEVDFTGCDLTGSTFSNCDLSRTRFDRTILEKTDFRTSYNYSIDPEINRMKKAKFSIPGVVGLLDKYGIVVES